MYHNTNIKSNNIIEYTLYLTHTTLELVIKTSSSLPVGTLFQSTFSGEDFCINLSKTSLFSVIVYYFSI